MLNQSIKLRVGKWLAGLALLGFGLAALAQSEPTLSQVYEAARAGQMDQAQMMMQQVLVAHPNSAKAHFVQAELAARQGQLGRARESLGVAEKLAPGLPFAKPEAVQHLRAQLAAGAGTPVLRDQSQHTFDTALPVAPSSQFPWGLALALGGGALAIGILMLRRKPAATLAPQAAYAGQTAVPGGLSGPQTFGMGGAGAMPAPYGQPPAGGMGSRVMGGLATGLAVGAGVMAAQAIGKSLMGNDEHPAHPLDNNAGNNGYAPFGGNGDMGGQDFGVNDAGSWDDGNAIGGDGGGWDS